MRDLGAGFGYLLKGQRWVARHGKQYGFGLLPGLITLVLYAAALVALAFWGEDFVAWATPFADDWSSPWQGLFRGFLTVVLFALSLLLSVLTFTAVTLLVGQPFYESLSEKVDQDVSPDGTAPSPASRSGASCGSRHGTASGSSYGPCCGASSSSPSASSRSSARPSSP
ncbi:hypothetical protein SAVCW2_20840 [Streptomyces avermitilis]|nr:hypothetical protein SAVCW2_20840 [Streptomyces avermitilis]